MGQVRAGDGIGHGLAGAGANQMFREHGTKEGDSRQRWGWGLSRVTGKWDSRQRVGNQAGYRSRTGQSPASGSKGRDRPESKDGNQEGCMGV